MASAKPAATVVMDLRKQVELVFVRMVGDYAGPSRGVQARSSLVWFGTAQASTL
jgi:hypothetical protein